MKKSSSQPHILALDSLASQALLTLSTLAVVVFLPSFIHQQAITGPIINAVLLLSAVVQGPSTAMMIGLVPSIAALSRGLLPLPLAPVVPFIMAANGIYIYVFSLLAKKSFAAAISTASLAKFIFLHFTSQFLLAQLLPSQFVTPAAKMMSWPQLVTALAGGVIAWVVLQTLSINNQRVN